MNAKRAARAALALSAALPMLTGCNAKNEDATTATLQNPKTAPLSLHSVPETAANAGGTAAKVPQTAQATAATEKSADAFASEQKVASSPSEPQGAFRGKSAVYSGSAKDTSLTSSDSAASPASGYVRMRYSEVDKGAAPAPNVRFQAQNRASFSHPMTLNKGMAGGANPMPSAPHAVYNPNMYVADTYIGGNGEKDRLQKLIQSGVLVDGKRVKLEAFTHNYAQSFPIPQQTALNVSADAVQSKIIQSGAHTYLQIGLQATKGELPRRPPLNVALVIDRSGSMQEEHKLEYAKSAAVQLVNSLTPADTFSLVAFDDTANLLVPAQHVTNKARIRNLIAGLYPGGGTNIYDGLAKAYGQVHKNTTSEGINRVILLSDGQVTSGVQDRTQFHHLAASEVDKDVETSAVGVGVEFNEDLMLSLARDGKGNYHFLKDGADTQQVFARELNELTHVVAKDVKLRIQLAPGVGLIRVLGAQTLDAQQTAQVKQDEKKIDRKVSEELGIAANRQNAPEEPGIKMLIPAIYRGDSHIVMLEIKAPPQGLNPVMTKSTAEVAANPINPNICTLASVFVKYKDLIHPANREARATASVSYTPSKDEMIYSVNRSVKKNLLGFQTGEALTQAARSIEQGRIGDAIAQVEERRNVVSIAAQKWQDSDLNRDGKLLDRYKAVLSQLNAHQQLAQGDFGQYLRRSLAYNGYTMTR